jgi:trans-aconitate methyltransferase
VERSFSNVYDDQQRARAYAQLDFPGTYYLAFRDLPSLIQQHAVGQRALDFGCGTGRSTRFLRSLNLHVVGIDISEPMLAEARARDPSGDYRRVSEGDLGTLGNGAFDVILAAFTFDNIPTDVAKLRALGSLRGLLSAAGRLTVVVSSPAIYLNEWASFSTRDYPQNRDARDGDTVRIVMLDVPDRRPVEDVVCSDARYRELFAQAGLSVLEVLHPLATGHEPVAWVSETTIAPWTIYVLAPSN